MHVQSKLYHHIMLDIWQTTSHHSGYVKHHHPMKGMANIISSCRVYRKSSYYAGYVKHHHWLARVAVSSRWNSEPWMVSVSVWFSLKNNKYFQYRSRYDFEIRSHLGHGLAYFILKSHLCLASRIWFYKICFDKVVKDNCLILD